MAVPLVRYFSHPVGRRIVSAPNTPIDIAAAYPPHGRRR
jgi:hypothetical protein